MSVSEFVCNQSADSTSWTGFSIIIHDTVWMPMPRMPKFTHSMFHFKVFCVNSNSLNLLLCYEQQKQFNIHRHSPSALSVLWYKPETGWLGLITERDQEIVSHVYSCLWWLRS